MRRTDLELKVGIFIFIGLVIFTFIVFSISDTYYFKPGYHIKVEFNFVNGVELGAPVRLAGITVGEVTESHVYYDEEKGRSIVQLLLWIRKDVIIEENAEVYTNTLGLLGERYIEIIPGTKGSRPLKDNDLIKGVDSVPVEKLTQEMYRIAANLSQTLEGVNKLFGDETARDSLKEAFINSKELINNLNTLVVNANAILTHVKEGRGTIGKLLYEEKIYDDTQALVEDVRKHPWKLLIKGKERK
jgi:phospholipid/cholesterol/gamma-HCH transport system substrate-binding protein